MSLSGRENQDLTIDGKTYTHQKSLEGRGQSGLAGFYLNLDNKRSYLIKEDDVATCLLEGSARFVKKHLPKNHQEVINFAELVYITKPNEEQQTVASKQPKVMNSEPWDKVIFGKKRIAKLPFSREFLSLYKLPSHLAGLSHHLKSDLAAALFGSSLAGDESLHTGQFMAVMKDGKIIRLVRIDLGARERFAWLRITNGDVQAQTSQSYTKSSLQVGKNYLDFLLKNPDVNAKYLRLCMLSVQDPKAMARESAKSFFQALNKLPEDQRDEACWKVYQTYAKDHPDQRTRENFSKENLELIIKECASTRAKRLKRDATKKIKESLDQFKLIFKTESGQIPQITNTINSNFKFSDSEQVRAGEESDLMNELEKIYQNFIEKGTTGKKIKAFNEILSHLYAAIEFSEPTAGVSHQLILGKIKQMQDKVQEHEKGLGNWIKNNKKKIIVGCLLVSGIAIGSVLTCGALGIIAGGVTGGFAWLGSMMGIGSLTTSSSLITGAGIVTVGIGAPPVCLLLTYAVKKSVSTVCNMIGKIRNSLSLSKSISKSKNGDAEDKGTSLANVVYQDLYTEGSTAKMLRGSNYSKENKEEGSCNQKNSSTYGSRANYQNFNMSGSINDSFNDSFTAIAADPLLPSERRASTLTA